VAGQDAERIIPSSFETEPWLEYSGSLQSGQVKRPGRTGERMRYYELHESEYVKRLSRGHQGWDAGEYDAFFMKAFVERSLEAFGRDGRGLRVLDLGCGTGALSCLLASRGFDVTGVDVSTTAISYAKRVAAERGLAIDYQVLDVCGHPLPSSAFDLVIDSHLLHCLAFDEDRQVLLQKVRGALSPNGQFWIETMYLPQGQTPKPEWHLDEHGVVWCRHDGNVKCSDNVQRDGYWWTPMRLIARSPEFLLEELNRSGLKIIEWETCNPLQPGDTGEFHARCVNGGA
jgi:2-polyprenyl-3-methyl-5-hydroxy-6-metoxy-1,4-benzoquinol methylase